MSIKAIEAFSATLERAETLLALHSATRGRPPKEKEDILRAAVMLAVAAVDSYFHDKILERLTPFLQTRRGSRIPGSLIKLLEKHGGVEKMLEILYADRPHRRIHTIVRRAQAELTFQKPDKIEAALRLLGISDLWYRVATEMKHGASKERVKKRLGQYAWRRDKIAHEADRTTGGKPTPIRKPYVTDCISFLRRFIRAADRVIDQATGG
ncbi:MAG: hypothetical protein ACLF0G_01510 [Candidatus Brocadiia bacterium]